MHRIVLIGIVRNEESIIRRCLDSVRPMIDMVAISDTGSSDSTRETIRQWCEENQIPGWVSLDPWQDFATNRNGAISWGKLCMKAAKWNPRETYFMTIDSDEVLDGVETIDKQALTEDLYYAQTNYAGLKYLRPLLFRASKPWHYVMPVHETLMCEEDYTKATLEGVTNIPHQDGARSKDPHKFAKDADLLARYCAEHQEDARAHFYLAQSCYDAGGHLKAAFYYNEAARMSTWPEQTYVALLNRGKALEKAGEPENIVRAAYLSAHEYRPHRGEAMFNLMRYLKERGQNPQLWMVQAWTKSDPTKDSLFVATNEYPQWREDVPSWQDGDV